MWAYNFHAIVRHLDSNGSMIGLKADDENPNVVEGRYMVLPLEGGDGLITGIDAVAAADSELLSVRYVNMLGMESTTPYAGLNIVVKRYSNGNLVVTKEFIR